MRIISSRFILKPLTRHDVNNRYLSWLTKNNTAGYIDYAKNTITLVDLMQYVKDRENKKEVLFLGVFTKDNNQHIGNIKYEPIDFKKKQATMGILIGDKSWRGKGVAGEIIIASADYLKQKHNIQTILLGVDINNTSAVRAYQKIGFKANNQQESTAQMSLML